MSLKEEEMEANGITPLGGCRMLRSFEKTRFDPSMPTFSFEVPFHA
jgi:hypothetical protein